MIVYADAKYDDGSGPLIKVGTSQNSQNSGKLRYAHGYDASGSEGCEKGRSVVEEFNSARLSFCAVREIAPPASVSDSLILRINNDGFECALTVASDTGWVTIVDDETGERIKNETVLGTGEYRLVITTGKAAD